MQKTSPKAKPEPLKCYLCEKHLRELNYKDAEVLRQFITLQGKIRPPRKTGTCTRHQRIIARAVKRARVMAILPIKRV